MYVLTITNPAGMAYQREFATVAEAREAARKWRGCRCHLAAQDGSTLDEWDSEPPAPAADD